jgi:anti-anti-sigma factor
MDVLDDAQLLPMTTLSLGRIGDAGLVKLSCPSIRERQAAVLGRHLHEVAEHVRGRLVLEVSCVSQFTCAWINTLIALARRCRDLGGELILMGLSRKEVAMLRATGLEKYLCLAHGQQEVLKRLGQHRGPQWKVALAKLLKLPVSPVPGYARAA